MKQFFAKLEDAFEGLVLESERTSIGELLDELAFGKAPTKKTITATEKRVSTKHILSEMELTKANTRIVQVELEDIRLRQTDREVIFQATTNLLSCRAWREIRFIDTIHVAGGSEERSLSQAWSLLADYESAALKHFRDLLQAPTKNGMPIVGDEKHPITFQTNIEIDKGISLDGLLTVFKILKSSYATRVDFGKLKIADLFNNKDRESKDPRYHDMGDLCTREAITLKLIYLPPDQTALKEKEYTMFLFSECIKKMHGIKKSPQIEDPCGSLESESDLKSCDAKATSRCTDSHF